MLLRIIEAIRKKPKLLRQQYALVVTVVFTAIVAGVWSLSLPARFGTIQQGLSFTPTTEQTASLPFSGLWRYFKKEASNLAGLNSETTLVPVKLDQPLPPADATLPGQTILLDSGSTITIGGVTATNTTTNIMLETTTTGTSSTNSVQD